MVESREIYVVPNFISEGYFTRTVIPREMELSGCVTVRDGRTIKYCEPTGKHPRMTELLKAAAQAAAPGVAPEETSLLIVGHGTRRDPCSAEATNFQAGKISRTGGYAEVMAAYMDEPPLIAEWDRLASQPNVVVVPFFISEGLHASQDIPVLLGIRSEPGEVAGMPAGFPHNPHDLRGKQLFYGATIGSSPGFADILLDQVRRTSWELALDLDKAFVDRAQAIRDDPGTADLGNEVRLSKLRLMLPGNRSSSSKF